MNKALFFHQFAALLKAGFSGAKSLEMVADKLSPPIQRYLKQASRRMDRGTSLALALQAPSCPFSPWELGLLNLGESSGALVPVSQRLGHLCEAYRRRARHYGSIVVSFGAIGGVILIIVGAWLLGGLAALNHPLVWGLAGVLTLALVFQTQVPLQVDLNERGYAWLRQIPLCRQIITARSLTQLAELAIPIRCGLPVPQALALVQARLSDPQLIQGIDRAIRRVDRGESLSRCLQGHLPPTALQMIHTGETTGQLDTLLDKLGEHYQGELDRSLRQLEGIARPFALLTVALLLSLVGMQIFQGVITGTQ